MKSKTKVNRVTKKTKSLRTRIPVEVVNALKIEDKDNIDWIIEAVDNELKVCVSKSEE